MFYLAFRLQAKITSASAFILSILAWQSFPQPFMVVEMLEGRAKVQHATKKSWDDLAHDSRIVDNDIIETFFQTRLTLKTKNGNIVKMGSNSKVLINYMEIIDNDSIKEEISLTLFSGGVFGKVTSKGRISLFTSNSVAESDMGAISAITEAKTAETGFQVLSGTANVRNIASITSKQLTAGQTTMIMSGREPTAPLYITNRHVSVLKHFFGADYISEQLSESGVKPTDDRFLKTESVFSGRYLATSFRDQIADYGTYRRLFSLQKIYGALERDNAQKRQRFSPVFLADGSNKGLLNISLGVSEAISGEGQMSGMYSLIGASTYKFVDASFRLSLIRQPFANARVIGMGSAGEILDKIAHVKVTHFGGRGNLFLGSLERLTVHNGLIARNYSNKENASFLHPLGVAGECFFDDFSAMFFLNNIANPVTAGICASLEKYPCLLGFGYYLERNVSNLRGIEKYSRFKSSSIESGAIWKNIGQAFHTLELDAELNIIFGEPFELWLIAETAQRIAEAGLDGFVVRIPGVDIFYRDMNFGLSLIHESGRLLYGQLHSFYQYNRARMVVDSSGVSIFSQNEILSKNRSTQSVEAFFRVNPFRGGALELSARTDFKTKAPVAYDTSLTPYNFDYSLDFSVDSSIMPYLSYASLFIRQPHGGLFPVGALGVNSFGFSAGALFVLSPIPILFNSAISMSFNLYQLDLDFNNRCNEADRILEIGLGLNRSFF